MEIKRDHYLTALHNRMHNGMVKIITGMRRSGKSYLLFRLFYQDLLAQGVKKDHIITLSMDGLENRPLREPAFALRKIKPLGADAGNGRTGSGHCFVRRSIDESEQNPCNVSKRRAFCYQSKYGTPVFGLSGRRFHGAESAAL